MRRISVIRSYKVSFLWAAASTSLLKACRIYGILLCARIEHNEWILKSDGVCVEGK